MGLLSGSLNRLDGLLRTRILGDKEFIGSRLYSRINPFDMEEIPDETALQAALTEFLPSAQLNIGCTEDATWVFGYYDPVWGLWLLASVGTTGSIDDLRLSGGLRADGGASDWWPALMEETGGPGAAMQLSTARQSEVFARIFPDSGCPSIAKVGAYFRDREGFDQVAAVTNNWATATEVTKEELRDRIAQREGARVPDGWDASLLIPLSDGASLVIHRNPREPGRVMLSTWESVGQGKVDLRETALFDMLAGRGA